jgi:hypothetical protein
MDKSELNPKLDEKLKTKKQAMQEAMPIRNALDDHGEIKIWLVAEKKWVNVWPVDAMEIMKIGGANLEGPQEEKPDVVQVDFSKYSAVELKAFCQIANIEGADTMTKKQLAEALTKAGYEPKPE